MVKVLLHGCNGRMGQVMTKVLGETPEMEIVAGVDVLPEKFQNPYPVYKTLGEVKEDADVLVDFSYHAAIDGLLSFGVARKIPLVICTSGHTEEERARMVLASKKVAVLNSANMSLGVNILLSLVKHLAPFAKDVFDIEIIEKHHKEKVDSPSGTAFMIARAINSRLEDTMEYSYGRRAQSEKRRQNEIGIHAVRGGAIVGEHTVLFAGQGETLEIKHSALSRDLFAYGAISAAKFIDGKTEGFYTMEDVIEGGR